MNNSTHLSEEMVAKINIVKRMAEDGEEGDESFLEISCCPVVSLFITTGSTRSDGSDKRNLHLDYKMEPSCFRNFNYSSIGPERIGYDIYTKVTCDEDKISLKEYGTLFNSVCSDIDRAIKTYHGIKCFEDGDDKNETIANVFILHLCDVLNIIHSQTSEMNPTLFLKTGLLKVLRRKTTYEFLETYVKGKNIDFLMKNIDVFYLCYAYFGNYSFVPIRTLVAHDSVVFKESKFFSNNPHFVRHQVGKMKSFNQNNRPRTSKMIYRSI